MFSNTKAVIKGSISILTYFLKVRGLFELYLDLYLKMKLHTEY